MTAKRKIRVDDLFELCIPGDIQITADASWLVWTERRADREATKTWSHLTGGRQGRPPRRLTFGKVNDSSPRFSPDGSQIAFLRKRPADSGQTAPTALCLLPTDGGESRVVFEARADFGPAAWSPDGRWLAISVRHHDPLEPGETHPRSIRVTRLNYKLDGTGYLPKDRFTVYRVDTGAEQPELVPVTDTDGDWDDESPRWSPDGTRIAFLSNRRDDRDRDVENADLFVVDVEGGSPIQCTTERGMVVEPAWSPDGTWLAVYACHGPIASALFRRNVDLYRVDPTGATPEQSLTGHTDRCAMNLTIDDLWGLDHWVVPPAITADGSSVFVPISDHGTTYLGRASASSPGDPVDRVVDDRVVVCFSVAAQANRIALITTTPTEPGQVEVRDLAGEQREVIAWPLRQYIETVDIGEPIEIRVDSSEDTEIQGWLLLPPGDGPFPLLLDIHGGPVVQFGRSFFHELQLYRARGYAVLYVNPRGSQGYGAEFAAAIHRDWGTRPHADLMAAVDHVLADHPIDPDRLGVLGGSYGGYMTTWICGHDNRFKAACTQRTVSSMEAMIWSDCGFILGDELEAQWWQDKALYERMSPITYAESIETPMLVLQGTGDMRTPADQGERLFVTLRLMGKEAEMVLFPGGTHDLSRNGPPHQRVERLEVILDWFDRYLSP